MTAPWLHTSAVLKSLGTLLLLGAGNLNIQRFKCALCHAPAAMRCLPFELTCKQSPKHLSLLLLVVVLTQALSHSHTHALTHGIAETQQRDEHKSLSFLLLLTETR